MMTEEQKKLIEDNMPLLKYLFLKYHKQEWNEDLYQEAVLNICRNMDKYDPERGTYGTWAGWVIRSTIGHHYYVHDKDKYSKYQEVSLQYRYSVHDSVCGDSADKNYILEETVGTIDKGYDDFESSIMNKQICNKIITQCHLSSKQKKLIKAVMEEGKDISSLYKEWGCSRQNINAILQNIQAKVKKYYKEEI